MTTTAILATLQRALVLGAIWLVLTGAEPKGLVFGAVAVPAAVWTSLRLLPAERPLRLWRLAGHAPRFLLGSVVGAVDVARRAVLPRMRIAPGWVEVAVPLSGGARAVVGGELTLMPGTLAAGSRGDRLLVHLIDTGAGLEQSIPKTVAAIAAMAGEGRAGEAAAR